MLPGMSRGKVSAGLLPYRVRDGGLEVLLVHPGGPFFARKDEGAWSVPKGLLEEGEEALATARRECAEETGLAPVGPFLSLGEVRQKGGKQVLAWAADVGQLPWDEGAPPPSNTFEMEWPRGSGVMRSFPEVDRAEFFAPEVARRKINAAQVALVDRLEAALEQAPGG